MNEMIPWTTADDEILLTEYKGGHFGLIRRLADKLRRSRNAVIGRANRLGLSRAKESWKGKPTPNVFRPVKRPLLFNMIDDSEITADQIWSWAANRTNIIDLQTHHCRWPVGNLDFCGGDKFNGSPYCRAHCRLAYGKTAFQAVAE